MKSFWMLLLVCLTSLASAQLIARECDWTLTFDGIGPLKIGMTREEAENAIHMPLDFVGSALGEPRDYELYEPRSCPDAFQVLIWGKQRRDIAVIFAGTVKTMDAIRVGDQEEQVTKLKHLYQDLFFRLAPREAGFDPSASHQYLLTPVPLGFENGAFQKESKYELDYFVQKGKVLEIRSGLRPDAGYDDIGHEFRKNKQ